MSCEIELDNPGVLSPGDKIMGKVICTFLNNENILGIICKFRGREGTTWNEADTQRATKAYYSAKRKFLVENAILAGEGPMNAGSYVYPFVFKLPGPPIPSSYDHRYGSIRYYIKAKVNKPSGFDYKADILLYVASPINFNLSTDDLRMMAVTYQIEEATKICFCRTGNPIAMNMNLEKDAFILGEVIKAKVEVNNRSNIDIESVTITLASHLQFKATKPRVLYQDVKDVAATFSTFGVKKLCQELYDFNLAIPKMLIPNFSNCTLLKQWWTLTVEACLGSCYKNISLEAYLRMGHIPLNSCIPQEETLMNISNNYESLREAPAIDAGPPYPTDDHPSFPKPSATNEDPPYPLQDHPSFPMPNSSQNHSSSNQRASHMLQVPLATEEEVGSLLCLLDSLGIDSGLPLVFPSAPVPHSTLNNPSAPPPYREVMR